MIGQADQIGPIEAENLPGRREMAAALAAEDRLPDRLIAKRVGIAKSTLAVWKLDPEFRARVGAIRAEIRAEIMARGVADLEARIAALDGRWRELNSVIVERAESPEMQEVAGGQTGLLTRNIKGIGKGDDFRVVEVYEVDIGLLRELRELEKQAAKELGQWVDKTEEVEDETDDLDEIRGRFDRRLRARRDGGVPGEPVQG